MMKRLKIALTRIANSQNEAKEMRHEEGKLTLGFHARVNARLISKLETTKLNNQKTVSLPYPQTKRYDYIAYNRE